MPGLAKSALLLFSVLTLPGSRAPVYAQSSGGPPLFASTILMREPLGETDGPKMSMFILNLAAGGTVPSHSHRGAVFAYVVEGNIDNQVEPDPPKTLHPGDLFHERPMQVHRIFRNLSKSDPAKLLILQNTGALPASLKPLLQEPLTDIADQEVTVIRFIANPGAAIPEAHQHPGPVFAYILSGEVESQVDPDQPHTYRAGDAFYEPPMHTHRLFRNVSETEAATLIIFEVSQKGKPLAMGLRE